MKEGQTGDQVHVSQEFVQDNKFGPDVVLDEKSTEWTIWAVINTADEHGISVENIKDGDTITIEYISGIGYFGGHSGWWKVLSTVYKIGGAFIRTDSVPANIITALSEETLPGAGKGDDDHRQSKPRDGYGRKLDDGGNFAKEEGGIVVCVPQAGGPMYAHSGNHFKNEKARSIDNLKKGSEMKGNCFFPTRAREKRALKAGGILYIYAFDRNYRDNAGSYEVKFRIERSQ